MSAGSTRGRGHRAARWAAGVCIAAGVSVVACGRAPRRAREVMPGHAWKAVSGRGPTYDLRAGQQVVMLGPGGMMTGTYQFPSDSTLALDVTGRIPGASLEPMHLSPRFDVRVLPRGSDGRERVEFRVGSAVDTLARAD